MIPQSSTRTLRILLGAHLALSVGTLVETLVHVRIPDGPLTGSDAVVGVLAVCLLVAYAVGLIGLWKTKAWGRVAFGLYATVSLLPVFNDPTLETKLSLSLATAGSLVAGVILGLVFVAMRDTFGGTRGHKVSQVFS